MLDSLNPKQLKAVTHEKGPLLIIAGAGTGKTKVITSRILYLIQEKKVPEKSILALTFTEKATEEMIERVDMAMPLGYEEINIKTFHGFCDQILRERGLEIGINTDYNLLDKPDLFLLIKKILFKFELDYYRPLGNPTKFIYSLIQHFSRLKDEDISPEKYLKYIKEKKQNSKNPDEQELEELLKNEEIALAYQKYQEILLQNNVMDFNDLTFYALRLLENRKSVLKEYQDKFKYILVDEFQDTNFAQNKLITLLAEKEKNIMAVGDDDQGIYRFRGATVNNILEFEKHFPELDKVVLKKNYRSTQEILDKSYNVIINNNPHRLESKSGINKKLEAIKNEKNENCVQTLEFSNYTDELNFITETIKNKISSGSNYKDIAILTRTNSLAKTIVESLKSNQIPTALLSNEGIFSKEEIKDLIATLRFLYDLGDDIALFRIITLPFFDLNMEKSLNLLQKAKKTNNTLWETVKSASANPTLFDINKTAETKIIHILSDLIEYSKDHTVSQVLGRLLYDHNYLKYFTNQEKTTKNLHEIIQNISYFGEKVAEFEKTHSENKVINFMEYLNSLEDAGENPRRINFNQEENSVKIMTVHASKGLEFPIVFLPFMVNLRFPSINRSEPIEIPEELLPEYIPDSDYHIREERRLFYVAMTRAQKEVILTWSEFYEGKKKWKKSIFIEEMKTKISINTKENSKTTPNTDIPVKPAKITRMSELPILNDNKKFSYSKLDCFKTCALQFKYRYLYGLSSPMPHAASFGSSVHNTLNEFYKTLKSIGAENITLKHLEDIYKKNWIPYGYESAAHQMTRKKKGWEMLKNYFEKNSNPWIIPEFLEREFNLKIEDFTLSGRIDRIDRLEDGTYEVIDYKTGKLKKNQNLKNDLQLSIYALVCRDLYKIPIKHLSLYFIEDDEKISTTRTDEDLNKVKNEIMEIKSELQQSNFSPTPGFYCDYCDFRLLCWAV